MDSLGSDVVGTQGAKISIDTSTTAGMAPTALHHLPCSIKYDGYAGVSAYFHSTVVKTGEEKHEARFRGRLLEGRCIKLPDGVQGVVFRERTAGGSGGSGTMMGTAATAAAPGEEPEEEEEEGQRAWYADGHFENLTYWTHDKVMSELDHIPMALQWMKHASALHAPLEADACES